MSHEASLKIRSYHTDSFGHVNNARYLELLEEARWQFAEHHGLVQLLNEENLGFIIMDLNLRFRLPIVEGDTIQVRTSLITLGTSLGEVEQMIRNKATGKLAAKSLCTFVLIDRNTAISVPIEGRIRELLLRIIEPKKGSGRLPDPSA